MRFGVFQPSRPQTVENSIEIESLGFSEIWMPDFQANGADPFVMIALAADRTRAVRFCISVCNPKTRHASVTANLAATLTNLYPGRFSLGVGTGAAPLRMLGESPATIHELTDYVRALRRILAPEGVSGMDPTQAEPHFRFLESASDALAMGTDTEVRVAAGGPKALRVAGALSDMVILPTRDHDLLGVMLDHIREGAQSMDRPTPAVAVLLAVSIDKPPDNGRLLNEVGGYVPNMLLSTWRLGVEYEGLLSPGLTEAFRRTRDAVTGNARITSSSRAPERSPSRSEQYEGYLRQIPAWQRELLTPEAIRAKTLMGTPDDIRGDLETLKEVGVSLVVLYPNNEDPTTIARFAQHFVATEPRRLDK